MHRGIVGFRQDAEEHWVAALACGHDQHVRHAPPFVQRPWVLTEEGRSARLGQRLDCGRCDRSELPAGFAAYRSTPEFDETGIPAALLTRHDTKAAVWARILVAEGSIDYRILEPFHRVERLDAQAPGIVIPEVPHQLEVIGPVRLHLEFWRHAD